MIHLQRLVMSSAITVTWVPELMPVTNVSDPQIVPVNPAQHLVKNPEKLSATNPKNPKPMEISSKDFYLNIIDTIDTNPIYTQVRQNRQSNHGHKLNICTKWKVESTCLTKSDKIDKKSLKIDRHNWPKIDNSVIKIGPNQNSNSLQEQNHQKFQFTRFEKCIEWFRWS